MSIILKKLGVAVSLAFSFESAVYAANTTIDLQAVDSGSYSGITGTHIAANTSIYIQQDAGSSDRNFFVFDFSSLNLSNLVAMDLYVNNSWNLSSENQISYTIFDVTTNIADLRAGGNAKYAEYNDLGTGVEYASLQITNPTRYDNLNISFNQAAIDAAKATTGLFAFGGSFTSQTNGISFIYGDNENPAAPLSYGLRLTFTESVTAVPEADSYAMLLVGLGLLGVATRRRNGGGDK